MQSYQPFHLVMGKNTKIWVRVRSGFFDDKGLFGFFIDGIGNICFHGGHLLRINCKYQLTD